MQDAIGTAPEILDVAGMARADALAIARGTPGIVLMENAGAAVASTAQQLLPGGQGRVLVLAGPGNNGGDGWVAARLLAESGCDVLLAAMKPRQALKGDAALAAARWQGETISTDDLLARPAETLQSFDLVVDALFGAGLDRPLAGNVATLVQRVNEARACDHVKVLAVDVPSGIHGDSGLPMGGGPAIMADATITFFRNKPAHLLVPGRQFCGQVHLADIGIPASVLHEIAPVALASTPALWQAALPHLPPDVHKYARGSLMVLSGDALHTGASRLAALAGLHIGAGVVSLAGAREALLVHAAHLTEVMLDEIADAAGFIDALRRKRAHAAVIGPAAGVNARTRGITLAALREAADVALVLDADVFSIFAEDPQPLFDAIAGRAAPVVLTPHAGEFARLFPDIAADETGNGKLWQARTAAGRAGAIVVLKGPDTVIAHPDSRAVIQPDAPPWLATAGSGDVLAGAIGALLARGMDAFDAACAAVWLHAHAAFDIGPALVATDLPRAMGRLLAGMTATHG